MKVSPKDLGKVILANIRKTLLECGNATKVELSEKLKISFPTISKFLTQMEENGEIISLGLDESSGGRRAKRYMYNPDYRLGLAIFLEKTKTEYTIFNCVGEVKEKGQAASVLKDDGIYLLTRFIEEIMEKFSSKISSMAIGVPGSVENGHIFHIPEYLQFQNFNLKGYLEETFLIPVVVENDMNAVVLGYRHHKGVPKSHNLVYIYLGKNGPGAGLIVNGDVVKGSTFFAGEVSFVPQYDQLQFGQVLAHDEGSTETFQTDAISRLVASFVAIINPHRIIFNREEVNHDRLTEILLASSKYIPQKHLPELTMGDWEQDYLLGLQFLCIERMMYEL